MDAITIKIYASSDNEGYMYDIYNEEMTEDSESVDGGLCTTTMMNALGMAVKQAEVLIEKEMGIECPGCSVNILEIDPQPEKPRDRVSGYSIHGHGEMCMECIDRELEEGDFIDAR